MFNHSQCWKPTLTRVSSEGDNHFYSFFWRARGKSLFTDSQKCASYTSLIFCFRSVLEFSSTMATSSCLVSSSRGVTGKEKGFLIHWFAKVSSPKYSPNCSRSPSNVQEQPVVQSPVVALPSPQHLPRLETFPLSPVQHEHTTGTTF